MSAYINTIVRQSPMRREKEGRVPIVVKAGERSTQLLMQTLYSMMVQPDKDIGIQDNI
jgi:hypothetical protein